LTRVYEDTVALKELIEAEGSLDEIDIIFLRRALLKLIQNVDYWNEEELKMEFISIIRSSKNYYDFKKT
jgi:hypothetical protein